jgi:radical SAM superfamily enzyme
VHNILAGTEGVVPQDQDGISVSARTDITNEQAAEQLATNDARNHNYEQVVLDLGLTEKRGRIEALQNRHEEFNQQIESMPYG